MKHDHNHEGEVNHTFEVPEQIKQGYARAKQHLQDHKEPYLAGVGFLVLGYLTRSKAGPEIVQTFTDSRNNVGTIINRSKNVEVVIQYVKARNYVANPVRCLETGEEWASQVEAAAAKLISETNLSQHLNGKQASVNGLHFIRV